MASIHALSWNTTSFLSKLSLFVKSHFRQRASLHSKNSYDRGNGYSALSSTYYSIAGTAMSRLNAIKRSSQVPILKPFRLLLWGLTWLPLGAWCAMRMTSLSDKALQLRGHLMTADQYDIRQSILRSEGRYRDARRCIEQGLGLKPIKAHTRGLFYVGFADVSLHEKDREAAEHFIGCAIRAAEIAEQDGEDRQAARIFAGCARLADVLKMRTPVWRQSLRDQAHKLADASGAKDQKLKLG